MRHEVVVYQTLQSAQRSRGGGLDPVQVERIVIIEERYTERTPATLTFMVFKSFYLYLFKFHQVNKKNFYDL